MLREEIKDWVYDVWDAGYDLLFEISGSVLTERDLDELEIDSCDVHICIYNDSIPLIDDEEVFVAFKSGNCNWRSSLTDLAEKEEDALVYGEITIADLTLYLVGIPERVDIAKLRLLDRP